MNEFPYTRELLHPLWIDKMNAVFQRDRHRCVYCNFPKSGSGKRQFFDKEERKLEIHFRQYLFDMKRNQYMEPWKYQLDLLQTVCSTCEKKGNSLFAIPIKKIL